VSSGEIRAVLFDAGQTLLHVRTSVGTEYARTAARHGIRVDADDIERRFRLAWVSSIDRARARGHRCSDAILSAEWREIVRETFPPEIPTVKLGPIFEELYSRFSSMDAWSLAPGVRASLETLRGLGIRLGVLSNWDSRLPVLLAQIGIRDCFHFTVISFETGFEKPHPEMFRRGMSLAGTLPRETLIVGDSLEADILPAIQLGMRTLWVAPREDLERRPDLGPGIDRLPEDPASFWGDLLSGRFWDGRAQRPVPCPRLEEDPFAGGLRKPWKPV